LSYPLPPDVEHADNKNPPCGGSRTDSYRIGRGRSHQPLAAVSGDSIPIAVKR